MRSKLDFHSLLEQRIEKLQEAIDQGHLPMSQREETYQCPKCQDSGWIDYTQKGVSFSKRCPCWIVKQERKRMERSGISLEFQTKQFQNFDTKNDPQLGKAKQRAVWYTKHFFEIESTRNNSILLCGQVGSGKTHLGTAICGELMNQQVAVLYLSYRESITKLKQNLLNETEYSQEIHRWMQARVLYIDDFLKGKLTESDVNIMYEIINYRYLNDLPMILSTEKSLEDLLAFDEAIGSRIIEMCRGNIIQLQGKELNYRLFS